MSESCPRWELGGGSGGSGGGGRGQGVLQGGIDDAQVICTLYGHELIGMVQYLASCLDADRP